MVGLLGPTPPGVSTCGGEGLDKAPLAVLLGVGAQALWLAGKVLGGSGPPQFGVPHVLHCNLMDHPLASTPGTSPELMEPETSNHSIQLPALTGGLPRLHELSPTRHAPYDDMQMGTPVSYRRHQLTSGSAPSCGHDRVRRWVSTEAPWASDRIFWSGGRERKWGRGFSGGFGGSRKARGHGEALAWAPGNWECHLGPFFGALGPIFQSVEKY